MPSTVGESGAPEKHGFALLQGWRVVAILLIAIAAPLWYLHNIRIYMPPNKADMVAVWKGTQMALQGHDPYAVSTTREIQKVFYGYVLPPGDTRNQIGFVYPMQTVLLFAPIAPLPWPVVRVGFLILFTALTALSVFLWARVVGLDLGRRSLAVAVILTLCSWPVMWGLQLVQPSLLVALLAAAGCFLLKRGNAVPAGLLFALATIKPQLVAVLIVWLLLWAALRRLWRFHISFSLALAALLAAAARLRSGWVDGWEKASADYASYRHLRLDLQTLFGHQLGLFFAAVFAVIGVAILWQNRSCTSQSRQFGAMCALSLALTICLLPTGQAMNYNQIFLLPGCLALIDARPVTYSAGLLRRIALGLIIWSFISVPIAVLGQAVLGPADLWYLLPFQSALIPIFVPIAFAWPFVQKVFARARIEETQTCSA